MLLLEGPDGAGKTSLLKKMVKRWDLDVMPRFADTHGPKEDPYNRVYQDQIARGTLRCGIYDRHPLISEYIYAPIVGRGIGHQFLWPSARQMRHQLAHDALLILCLPPLDEVKKNVARTEQMAGVVENIEAIYEQYQLLRITWPGKFITYDYTQEESPVWKSVPLHVTDWNRGK